jgi:Mycotoxin biosynthesis protein UstYa
MITKPLMTTVSHSVNTGFITKTLTRLSGFEGDDYPAYYPIDLPPVSLTPENTLHYQIYTTDAAVEWRSVFPPGGGFLHLGPDGRPFGLALFHQMHCLARIWEAMRNRKSNVHVHHCFNYLRQLILCEANPTIEPVIPILGRRSVNAEVPRVCKDWTKLYDLAQDDYYHSLAAVNGSTHLFS